MAAHDTTSIGASPGGSVDLIRPTLIARLAGLGSIFGKGFRDSRQTILILSVLMAVLIAVVASQVAIEYGTVAKRLALAGQMALLPEISSK